MYNSKKENYIERLTLSKGSEYTMLGDYVSMKTKTIFEHSVCGYQWSTSPDNMLRTKKGCPNCSGNARIDTSLFIKKVLDEAGSDYEVLGKYTNARTKILFKHLCCSKVFSTTPYSFLNLRTRCPHCAGTMKVSHLEICKRVLQEVGTEYIFKLTNGMSGKAKCTHATCNYSWETTPYNLIVKGIRCPKCAGNAKRTLPELQSIVDDMYGQGEYLFTGSYINNMTPITCRHSCGNEWDIAPANILSGKQCPSCRRESNGEKLVAKLLTGMGVKFIREHTMEGCSYKGRLRFDFYLPSINKAVEYDGEQHFRPVNFGGRGKEESVNAYKETVIRDYTKNVFCEDNNIPLLRLPYYMSDSEIANAINKFVMSSK